MTLVTTPVRFRTLNVPLIAPFTIGISPMLGKIALNYSSSSSSSNSLVFSLVRYLTSVLSGNADHHHDLNSSKLIVPSPSQSTPLIIFWHSAIEHSSPRLLSTS
ncbi:hypothetical protein L484_014656 [Morus notabilis]|uniref:Uncharacterized protein n=1 Tax=Morus notabilis TaxID=981085 RepID=W9SB61_9ROSA|nr:hypothetical protein L484_014656 [Morus notabilis]